MLRALLLSRRAPAGEGDCDNRNNDRAAAAVARRSSAACHLIAGGCTTTAGSAGVAAALLGAVVLLHVMVVDAGRAGSALLRPRRELLDRLAPKATTCVADSKCLDWSKTKNSTGRVFNHRSDNSLPFITSDDSLFPVRMTLYKCAVLAAARGYNYAAVQHGGECYGAADGSAAGPTSKSCSTPCTGNPQEICGGPCAYTVYDVTGREFQYTGRTDSRNVSDERALWGQYYFVPQVCPEGQYIAQWNLGFGPVVFESNRLVSIQGVCSDGTQLLAVRGSLAVHVTITSIPPLVDQSNAIRYTCTMLQADAANRIYRRDSLPVSRFLGQGNIKADESMSWKICTGVHKDWVAIGYEFMAGGLVENLRFIMASGNELGITTSNQSLHEKDLPVTTSKSRQGGITTVAIVLIAVGASLCLVVLAVLLALHWRSRRTQSKLAASFKAKLENDQQTLLQADAMAGSAEYDVFLSHAGEQKGGVVATIKHQFMTADPMASIFFDQSALEPGDEASKKMIQACSTASVGLMVLSPEYFKKPWPMRELHILLERYNKKQVKLVPVLYFDNWDDFKALVREYKKSARDSREREWAKDMQALCDITMCRKAEFKSDMEIAQEAVKQAMAQLRADRAAIARRAGQQPPSNWLVSG